MSEPGQRENSRSGHSSRLWSQLPDGAERALTSGLPPTDLQSLLLEVSRARAGQVTPSRLMERWSQDRFVWPSPVDPRRLSALEARLWELLPDEFHGVDLSPVTPLGTCAAVGAADQNRIVSTVRTNEVVSDPTNVLALEVARRRRADPGADVHLAGCHRVLRHQDFGPGFSPHFKLFALVSGGRDRGSSRTEADLLISHLGFWLSVLDTLAPDRGGAIAYSVFGVEGLADRVTDTVLPALTEFGAMLQEDSGRTRARGYYSSGAILINGVREGVELELGDGGFTDWTAQLTMNAKERCLISCLSTERLLALLEE